PGRAHRTTCGKRRPGTHKESACSSRRSIGAGSRSASPRDTSLGRDDAVRESWKPSGALPRRVLLILGTKVHRYENEGSNPGSNRRSDRKATAQGLEWFG